MQIYINICTQQKALDLWKEEIKNLSELRNSFLKKSNRSHRALTTDWSLKSCMLARWIVSERERANEREWKNCEWTYNLWRHNIFALARLLIKIKCNMCVRGDRLWGFSKDEEIFFSLKQNLMELSCGKFTYCLNLNFLFVSLFQIMRKIFQIMKEIIFWVPRLGNCFLSSLALLSHKNFWFNLKKKQFFLQFLKSWVQFSFRRSHSFYQSISFSWNILPRKFLPFRHFFTCPQKDRHCVKKLQKKISQMHQKQITQKKENSECVKLKERTEKMDKTDIYDDFYSFHLLPFIFG